ncbi:MAG TPA: hypothetical protein VFQ43_00070, partial [Nitrososphaera sp.]|nr:hypothetical protein [Nitrososphaera sp.]
YSLSADCLIGVHTLPLTRERAKISDTKPMDQIERRTWAANFLTHHLPSSILPIFFIVLLKCGKFL